MQRVNLVVLSVLLLVYMWEVEAMDLDEAMAIGERCKNEAGATDEDLRNYGLYNAANSRADKCMRACFMKTIGNLNENGKFVREVGYAISHAMAKGDDNLEKLYIESIDPCVDIEVPDDHCEAAEVYNECFRRTSTERGVSFALIQ